MTPEAREIRGGSEGCLRACEVTRTSLRVAELEQQVEAGIVERGPALGELDRSREETDRLLVCEASGGRPPRERGILHRRRAVGDRTRLDVVVRHLREVRLQIVRTQLPDRFRGAQVDLQASGGRERVVERVAHKDVREAEVVRRARHAYEHPGSNGLVEGVEEGLGIGFAQLLHHVERNVAAEDRRDIERRTATFRQRGNAASDRFLHTLGDLVGKPYRHARRGLVGEDETDELADEERIAVGAILDRVDHRRVDVAACNPLEVLGDLAGRETFEMDAPRTLGPSEIRECDGEWVLMGQLGRPVADHEDDARIPELAGEVLQQQQ